MKKVEEDRLSIDSDEEDFECYGTSEGKPVKTCPQDEVTAEMVRPTDFGATASLPAGTAETFSENIVNHSFSEREKDGERRKLKRIPYTRRPDRYGAIPYVTGYVFDLNMC